MTKYEQKAIRDVANFFNAYEQEMSDGTLDWANELDWFLMDRGWMTVSDIDGADATEIVHLKDENYDFVVVDCRQQYGFGDSSRYDCVQNS